MASEETLAPDEENDVGNVNRNDNIVSDENAILEGKLENVKWLVDALSCIYSPAHKAQDVTITIPTSGGLRFSVQHTGVLHASVLIPKVAFSSFRSPSNISTASPLRLRLNLSLVMECLNLFATGSSTSTSSTINTSANSTSNTSMINTVSAHIWYEGEGLPLCLRLWDGDAHTDCKLTTLATDNDDENEIIEDLGFYNYEVITNTIFESEILKDAIIELDYCGSLTSEIRINSIEKPKFTLTSPANSGDHALCMISLPDPDDRLIEAFQVFQCKRDLCSVYKLQHLKRCIRALNLSQTCRLQINDQGMLSIVCKMKGVDTDRRGGGLDRCFVEFVIVAQEIEDDEDDEEGEQEGEEGEGEGGDDEEIGMERRKRKGNEEEEDRDEDEDEEEEVGGTPENDYY